MVAKVMNLPLVGRLGAHVSELIFKMEGSRLSQFHDRYKNRERCFIIGNGPSLQHQDLTLLRNEITFASNWFILHDDFEKINLKYLCMSNPKIWESGTLPPAMLEVIKTHPELTLFFEHTFFRQNWRGSIVDRSRCYFIRLDYQRPVYEGNVSLDPRQGTFHGHTVIVDLCLPLAYFMGFKEIYLIGCDSDYRLNEAADYSKSYFYDIRKMGKHPDPVSYMSGPWVSYVFGSYEVMKRSFEQSGRVIYNATHGGKLEVFPRVDFNSLF